MNQFKFKRGQRVQVIDSGKIYPTFSIMFKAWNFPNPEANHNLLLSGPQTYVGEIIHRGYHFDTGEIIYGVLIGDKQIIIGETGLSEAPKDQLELLINALKYNGYIDTIYTGGHKTWRLETIEDLVEDIRRKHIDF